jgi:L-serine dehydratase
MVDAVEHLRDGGHGGRGPADRVDARRLRAELAGSAFRRPFERVCWDRWIELSGGRRIVFELDKNIIFDTKRQFDRHPNAMESKALDASDNVVASDTWFSIGGGFIERLGTESQEGHPKFPHGFNFQSSHDHLELCRVHSCTTADIVMANELARRSKEQTIEGIDNIINAMMKCIDRGLIQVGELPGGLRVRRWANALLTKSQNSQLSNSRSASHPFDDISAFAIAVNEENAAGGRVVTAPTSLMGLPASYPLSFATTTTSAKAPARTDCGLSCL